MAALITCITSYLVYMTLTVDFFCFVSKPVQFKIPLVCILWLSKGSLTQKNVHREKVRKCFLGLLWLRVVHQCAYLQVHAWVSGSHPQLCTFPEKESGITRPVVACMTKEWWSAILDRDLTCTYAHGRDGDSKGQVLQDCPVVEELFQKAIVGVTWNNSLNWPHLILGCCDPLHRMMALILLTLSHHRLVWWSLAVKSGESQWVFKTAFCCRGQNYNLNCIKRLFWPGHSGTCL